MKEYYLKTIKNYGLKKQIKKFNEESGELIEALTEYRLLFKQENNDKLVDHIASEMADNIYLLMQFKTFLNISDEQLESHLKYKVDRQQKRMEEENKKDKIKLNDIEIIAVKVIPKAFEIIIEQLEETKSVSRDLLDKFPDMIELLEEIYNEHKEG